MKSGTDHVIRENRDGPDTRLPGRYRKLTDVYIQPPVSCFGLMQIGAFDDIAEAGCRHADANLEEWVRERPDGVRMLRPGGAARRQASEPFQPRRMRSRDPSGRPATHLKCARHASGELHPASRVVFCNVRLLVWR